MKRVLCCLALLLSAAPAPAGFIVGPGPVVAGAGDEAYNLLAVDLNGPAALGPDAYLASRFDYQFTDFAGFDTTGSVTPVLLTGGGTSFTPVAVGAPVTYAGPTGFVSAPFGGADTFTLAGTTTVYAGLFWDATPPFSREPRMPVGYEGSGTTFVVYGGDTGPGANPPVTGTPVTGSAEGFFTRTYDFDIAVAPVPEPPTSLLALVGLGLAGGWGWLRRRRAGRQLCGSEGL